MASRVCLVHYHEIGLKGKNRARFERILMDSCKAALAAFSVSCITRISGHILITFSAKGEAERFNSVYQAYKKGREVTAKRLYLETMENVLKNSDKVILDPSAKGNGVVPLLPLNSLK